MNRNIIVCLNLNMIACLICYLYNAGLCLSHWIVLFYSSVILEVLIFGRIVTVVSLNFIPFLLQRKMEHVHMERH